MTEYISGIRWSLEESCFWTFWRKGLASITARPEYEVKRITKESTRSSSNVVPRLFTPYCNVLCDDYFKYLLKRNHFQQQKSKTNFEVHKKHLKVLVKRNWSMLKFYRVCTVSLIFKMYFLEIPWEISLLFISSAFRKCNRVSTILKIILVLGLCPQKAY